MNRWAENHWLRNTLLLGAMAAGGVLTQIIPTYEEMAALRDQPRTPAAATAPRGNAARATRKFDLSYIPAATVQRTV
jgi:hypothetical protein